MMFSSDSPPQDNSGFLQTASKEDTTSDKEQYPSLYDFSDFN